MKVRHNNTLLNLARFRQPIETLQYCAIDPFSVQIAHRSTHTHTQKEARV